MTNEVNYSEKYDVFLSYRRDGGEAMATLLHDRLVAKGYKVFLDIESLNSGSFNKKLLSVFSVGNQIYFKREDEFFRMNFDGSNIVSLYKNNEYKISYINTDGKKLFFSAKEGGIYSADLSMQKISQVSNVNARFTVNEDYIFYGVNNTYDYTLFRMNKDGTNVTEISNKYGDNINVLGNNSEKLLWIEEGGSWFLADYDGSNKEQIVRMNLTN